MKKKGTSMKWRIFLYIALFSAILLIVLWLFQTVFFDRFYKAIKLRRTTAAEESIHQLLNSLAIDSPDGNAAGELVLIAQNNDICLLVYNNFFQPVIVADVIPNCTLHKLAPVELRALYKMAFESGGRYVLRWGGDINNSYTITYEYNDGSMDSIQMQQPRRDRGRSMECIITAEIIVTDNGEQYIVFMNSVITPVNETVRTLRIQLITITGIILLMTIIIALIMSRRLTKPLSSMTDTALQLSTGDYNVHFDNSTGYLEIDTLGNTLNRAAVELSRVENLRSELLANISHDMRTPLTMIAGYGEIMRDIPGEINTENINIIVDEAKRLSDLVNDAMDITKLKSGEERLIPEDINLTKSIREIVARIGALMGGKGYHITFEYETEYCVFADEIKISQVIYNLINNALNYTGENKKVTVLQRRFGDDVCIDVIDSGSGIDECDLPFIFDRYYKGENKKRTTIGTGLGLAIVKAVLDLHGAKYGVSSQKGNGSDFWFSLPISSSFLIEDQP